MGNTLLFGIVLVLVGLVSCTSTVQHNAVPPSAAYKTDHSELGLIGGSVSKYYEWDREKFNNAVHEGKTVYLEFSANWCQICQKQELHLKAGFAELNDSNVIGFKVHYKDDETTAEHQALAQEYQVVYQHTKVILNNGDVVLKSPEGWEKDRFLSEIRTVQMTHG